MNKWSDKNYYLHVYCSEPFVFDVKFIIKRIAYLSWQIYGNKKVNFCEKGVWQSESCFIPGVYASTSETVRSGYERKQKKATEQERQVQQLKSAINDLRAEKLTIERDLQDRTQLEQSKSELLATNGTLTGEITVIKGFS